MRLSRRRRSLLYSGSHILAIVLTLVGSFLLAGSFIHQRHLCTAWHTHARGWYLLFTLIALFLFGYLALLWHLLSSTSIQTYHLLTSVIVFGGGVFVLLVVSMSCKTVGDVIKMAEQDRHNALHDALTGLPNRTLLQERIEQSILHAKRDMTTATIILLDLDHFKEVNDTLGHSVGDRLLQHITPRLTACVREIDTIARIGGDEFVAVLPSADKEDALRIAEKIHRFIDQPLKIDDHVFNIGSSMGIAIYPYHGKDAQSLLQHADFAMYKAKRGAGKCVVYDISEKEYSINRLELVARVRRAVRDKNFNMFFQPKMEVRSKTITSVEALLRWEDEKLGMVPPDEFIPIIEHLGLMKEMTLWIISQAINQQSAWSKQGLDMKIAVNISANNLSDSHFPDDIKKLFEQAHSNTGNITLEITEDSMMINPENALKLLTELSEMGVGLSIDDFGTGYSSLSYLKHLPASEVKIDRSFVSDIMTDESNAAIVYAIICLVRSLGYRIVAEGVENQDILDFISIWGCDCAQGFYICKPLSADDTYKFIVTSNSPLQRSQKK